jgi:hypothetical protein
LNKREIDMGIAIAGFVLTALALLVSLGFNYLQYTWRNEERAQHARDRTEAKAEQQHKERTLPEFFNMDGAPHPIAVTGSQHSVQGPFVHLWGLVTVVNPTESHMKIALHRLVLDGAEWAVTRLAFHLRSNPQERYERLSMVGNSKGDYELHFLFPEEKYPKALSGELWLTSSNREDEPFSVPIRFS